MEIQKDISLAQYTTFKIGGLAKYFAVVKTIEDLKEGVNFAEQNLLPLFVLGGGSNLLVSDDGFNGLVLKMEIKGIHFGYRKVEVGAGENWDGFVSETVRKNLIGLENLSLIPGTVGASVVQNIGAFGVEVKDIMVEVEVFDIKTGKLKRLNKQQCNFGYRTSLFKTKQGQDLIITKVVYKLKTKGKLNCNYLGIKKGLQDKNITVQNIRDVIIQTRKERYSALEKLGSAGCFFKNSIITKTEFKKLKKTFPDISFYNLSNGKIKISVAWLIEKFGWKGYQENNVGVYKKHSLILINYGSGTASEIKDLANKISKDIFLKTNLKIFPEVVFLN